MLKLLDARHIAAYLLLGLGFATVMGFMYMQYVYYDAMIETLNISNAQLGLLITILGATAFITSLPCGVFVDHVDVRKALSYSLFGMMVFCGLFAIFPTYQIAVVTWLCAGIIMSVWYSAIYKTIRVLAPPEAVGKSFGLFGIAVAIGSILVNVAGLALYDHFAQTSLQAGLSSILWAFSLQACSRPSLGTSLSWVSRPSSPSKTKVPASPWAISCASWVLP